MLVTLLRAESKGSVLDDVDAALARCALNLGDGPAAANMYMQVLQKTGEKHLEVGGFLRGEEREGGA